MPNIITVGFDDETKDVLKGLTAALQSAGLEEKAAHVDEKPARKPAKKAATEEPAVEKESEEEEGLTRDEVRLALKEYAALEGKEAAIKILKSAGASSIGELDEDKFDEVVQACE